MKISIVIPIYNDPKIYRCLESLKNSVYQDIEIISMIDWDKEGPAVMRNRGARKATGDVLFFMDSDATVYPDTLGKISERMKDPSIDGVSIIWDDKPLEDNFFSKFKAIEMNHLMKHYFTRVCGSNGTAIRKSVFEAVGGFDESFKEAGAEDFHFGLKVLDRYYNIVLDKTILMQHYFCDRYLFKGMIKYCKRAFHRATLLVRTPKIHGDWLAETSYNSKKLKRMYLATLFPPVFFIMNLKLYKKFLRYGVWFCIRATLFHYFYMLMITISGGLGYVYATLSNLLRNR